MRVSFGFLTLAALGAVSPTVSAQCTNAATASSYNGSSVNPMTLANVTLPMMGTSWEVDLDCTAHSAGLAILIGMDASTSGIFLPEGEILVDVFGGNPMLYTVLPHSTSVETFARDVPSDVAFCNFEVYVQGVCFGVVAQLSNALQISLGGACDADSVDQAGGNDTCVNPHDLGTLTDDFGELTQITANIHAENDVDWYTFTAVDADPLNPGLDNFYVRIQLTFNPGGAFQFEPPWVDFCDPSNTAPGSYFGGGIDFNSPNPPASGVDETRTYFVQVRKRDGQPPTCDSYTLEVSNGVYGP